MDVFCGCGRHRVVIYRIPFVWSLYPSNACEPYTFLAVLPAGWPLEGLKRQGDYNLFYPILWKEGAD